MNRRIQIVEPTLADNRGHCRSLLASFCEAAPELRVTVWADRHVPHDVLPCSNVEIRPWFRRSIRVPQSYLLVRRLLRGTDRLFVSTAGRTDVLLAHRALGRRGDSARVALFLHWLRPTPSRLASLRSVAARRPDMRLVGSTPSVVETLQDCGFTHVVHAPYPMTSRSPSVRYTGTFSHLLFAGAARRDKGFHRFVDLVARIADQGRTWPVVAQTGGDYYDRIEDAVRTDLDRLAALDYPLLRQEGGGLDAAAYAALYQGAVAVQLYEPADWGDRASGVTLDALSAGAPVLTFRNTWMARQADRFGAGISLDSGDPASWVEGVASLVDRYDEFSARAREAGRVLAGEYDPRRLVDAVMG